VKRVALRFASVETIQAATRAANERLRAMSGARLRSKHVANNKPASCLNHSGASASEIHSNQGARIGDCGRIGGA
jgi:hypothetical protein